MKRGRLLLITIVLVAVLLATVAAVPSPPRRVYEWGWAAGTIRWVPYSVCEHPWYNYYLTYYLGDDCGKELYLAGDFRPGDVGRYILARGIHLENAGCHILEITEYGEPCSP